MTQLPDDWKISNNNNVGYGKDKFKLSHTFILY